MQIKKILASVLVIGMIASITACNNGTSSSGANSTASGTESSAPVEISGEIRDITSMELIKEINIGWSLGNTLDAGSESHRGKEANVIETSWGNPTTTQEIIDAVKAAGFNGIRVPVTWDWSTGDAPDYIISEDWMNRVQEVVNYGIKNDMYVILNIHHETWDRPDVAKAEETKDRLIKVWTQIAERFQNYDEHLIFEGQNEPRMVGTSEEWTGGSEETRAVVNELNAAFVETIRNSGGNNKLRHLMIPTYAANSSETALDALELPANDDKIIVSLHAYIPYNFALKDNMKLNKWLADKTACTSDIDTLAKNIKTKFIDKGVAVIIGEFGARAKDNTVARADFAKYYIATLKNVGVPCFWWDNGAFTSGEAFALLNRRTLEWPFPEIVNSLMESAYANKTDEMPTPMETTAPAETTAAQTTLPAETTAA